MVSMVNIRVCYNSYKIVTFRVPEVQYTRISNNINFVMHTCIIFTFLHMQYMY